VQEKPLARVELSSDDMRAWSRPLYPRGRVDAAGETLIDLSTPEPERNFALLVISNWRSSHSYPLHCLKVTLRRRAHRADSKALVAQRLKRLTSIAAKLNRRDGMRLSRMHDIGGCRAVLRTIKQITKLVRFYTKSRAKNPETRAEFVRAYDYIHSPKIDGYRSVHLVYKYRSGSVHHQCWNGLRIEIQIRTRLQHAWATAVETVDTFLDMGLKTSEGSGSEGYGWGRFFALASSYIAYKEKCPLVPNTPSDADELVSELQGLVRGLSVEPQLRGWMTAMHHLEDETVAQRKSIRTAAVFLLTVDPVGRRVNYVAYPRERMREAQDEYLKLEQDAESRVQSVLVSVDSMDKIREAYPNYFADTTAFLAVLDEVMSPKELPRLRP
jgi:hypothetical protein